MALERLYPEDFTPREKFSKVQAVDLVESWPITYEQLRPYYQQAEKLFAVRGSLDPLRDNHLDPLADPDRMSEASAELFEFVSGKGMHPYRLPVASDCTTDCIGCQGFLCPSSCKKDASNTCLLPAVRDHGAVVLESCRVHRLDVSADVVRGVVCFVDDKEVHLEGDLVILAAGALESPCILLRSRNADWPDGVANRSGLVGRNLMRHYVDLYPVRLKSADGLGSGRKQTCHERSLSEQRICRGHDSIVRLTSASDSHCGRHATRPT